jgi:two-component system cell cycle response regulator DivK
MRTPDTEMDGYEAARRVKRSPGGDRPTIVAVTSHAMSGDREKAIVPGFFGYTEKQKPMVTESFVSQIEQFFSGKGSPP